MRMHRPSDLFVYVKRKKERNIVNTRIYSEAAKKGIFVLKAIKARRKIVLSKRAKKSSKQTHRETWFWTSTCTYSIRINVRLLGIIHSSAKKASIKEMVWTERSACKQNLGEVPFVASGNLFSEISSRVIPTFSHFSATASADDCFFVDSLALYLRRFFICFQIHTGIATRIVIQAKVVNAIFNCRTKSCQIYFHCVLMTRFCFHKIHIFFYFIFFVVYVRTSLRNPKIAWSNRCNAPNVTCRSHRAFIAFLYWHN